MSHAAVCREELLAEETGSTVTVRCDNSQCQTIRPCEPFYCAWDGFEKKSDMTCHVNCSVSGLRIIYEGGEQNQGDS